ncbi:ubiquinone biosynthesis protein UbiB [Streptomyces sp. CB00316]|uniref:ABC1 kinase family protein n=1 Tax=unclassified Streptomyces TaxID=2593676 RepID=UPI00093DB8C2|nr:MULTISPECIES: AarF/UbiB family protein [unclassified Streptomyces]MBT2377961.1 AarF/ABC1/UbiB kinase family protein [Streptomyces sp. ISL-111]MBT2428875.1 AarF/ABC1/UbiB kinase family protein [Streptomyces sp. ISL-112]MBT2461291.1 AarF/ABC1/UbiB kinase family protein [Streptomyces sp. ISL-63]OKJ19566.1 ubiquinone biosynthesis protein UbiB [Streptomyces sp. CB00316]
MQHAAFLILIPVLFVFTLVGLSMGARRLLGIRIGKIRAAIAGTVGVLATMQIISAMGPSSHRPAMTSVQVLCGILVTMLFLAFSEVLLPSSVLSGIVRLPSALRRRVARIRRYAELSAIAMRNGLSPSLRGLARAGSPKGTVADRRHAARRVRLALEEAGSTFVKLGQMLSTRYDLLPTEYVEEFSQLHHQAAPEPWERVREALTEELGRDPDAVFAFFDPQPLAAGSMAQVHRARLADGQEIVVKIQRPGAEPVVERDLDILHRLGRKLEENTNWARRLGLCELINGFAVSLHDELDFRTEARNMAAVTAGASAPGAVEAIRTPRVHEEYSTRRVLTLEWLDGVPLTSVGQSVADRGLDGAELARQLLDCVLEQIVLGGVFHADPHPGNVLLLDCGELGLIDFGSVGRLDRTMRSALRDLLMAFHRGDPTALSDALLEIVDRPEQIDERKLERSLGRFMARHLGPGSRQNREIFSELFLLVARHGLAVPPEVAATFRALATVEGTVERLAPDFDIVAEARRFAAARVREQMTYERVKTSLIEEAISVTSVLRRLPRRVERITSALEDGRLGVRVRLLADERDRRFVRGLVHDVLLSFIGGITALVGAVLLSIDSAPTIMGSVSLSQLIGYNLLAVSCILVLRVIFSISRGRG